MKQPKPVYTFRVNKDLIDKARKQGISVSEVLEAALAKAIHDKRCPYCGQDIKK